MGDVLNRGTKDRPRWYCRFVDLDGKRKQRATNAATKAEARVFLEQIEGRVEAGLVGCPQQADRAELKQRMAAELEQRAARQTVTLRQLAERFLGDVEGDPGYMPPKIKSLANYRGDARSALETHVLPRLGDRPAAEVTLHDVEKMRDTIAKRRKPSTVTHAIAILSRVYTWARRAGLVDCSNPAQGVERPRSEHTVDFLSRDEVRRLLDKARTLAEREGATLAERTRFPAVALAIFAGLRKGELFGLRWRDLSLDSGRLMVARSYKLAPKSGKPRHVPINGELAEVLRAWRAACPTNEGDLVLPVEGEPGKLRMGIERDDLEIKALFAAAECHAPTDGKHWHGLRHTFASHFMMSGGSLFALQRLLGHASPMMSQRYAHLAPDFLRAEVARISFGSLPAARIDSLDGARRARSGTG